MEYGKAILIYECVNDEEFVYSYELLQKFRSMKMWLIQVYREYESNDEDEYYVNKVYRAEDGSLWLQCMKQNKDDILQIYYISS